MKSLDEQLKLAKADVEFWQDVLSLSQGEHPRASANLLAAHEHLYKLKEQL